MKDFKVRVVCDCGFETDEILSIRLRTDLQKAHELFNNTEFLATKLVGRILTECGSFTSGCKIVDAKADVRFTNDYYNNRQEIYLVKTKRIK